MYGCSYMISFSTQFWNTKPDDGCFIQLKHVALLIMLCTDCFIYCYIPSFSWKYYSGNFVVCSQKVYDVERPQSEYGFIQRWQSYTLRVSKLPINELHTSFCTLENYTCIMHWTAAVFLGTVHLLWNIFTEKNKADIYLIIVHIQVVRCWEDCNEWWETRCLTFPVHSVTATKDINQSFWVK